MKPCSVYCEPEKGIHVYTSWSMIPVQPSWGPYDLAAHRQTVIDISGMDPQPVVCYPMVGTLVEISIEQATEPGDPPVPSYPFPCLRRVQVLA